MRRQFVGLVALGSLLALGGCAYGVDDVGESSSDETHELDLASTPSQPGSGATVENAREMTTTGDDPGGPTPYPWLPHCDDPSGGPTPYPWEEETKSGAGTGTGTNDTQN